MNINLGKKIKDLRTAKKMTQSDLADRLGVTVSAISSYETIERQPTFETLVKMARFFNVTTDYLLGCGEKDSIDVTGLNVKQRSMLSDLASDYRRLNSYNRKHNENVRNRKINHTNNYEFDGEE